MKQRSTAAPKPSRPPAVEENYNCEDCVETASVDSFPASDPPGRICTKAAVDAEQDGTPDKRPR